jgi:integrase
MKGGIYTQEKCPICKSNLKFQDKKQSFSCPNHPEILGSGKCFVKFGRKVHKRFPDIKTAYHFLTGLRFKTIEGSYDPNDYQSDKPYSFINLSKKYLKTKSKLKSLKEVKRHIKVAQKYFGHKNVKDINGADLEDFAFSIPKISEKTRANYMSRLSDFWKWILRRGVINLAQMPLFPEIKFELEYRTITDLKTQEAIIDEVYSISNKINPKIWLGIDMLATYVNLRPSDLLKIRGRDIDLNYGVITIHHPTKSRNKTKTIRLLDRHIESIKNLQQKFPAVSDLLFFRHHGGIKSVQTNQPFGKKYLKRWWDKACKNLGVEDLDLYGGTRHTTTTEIAKRYGTENARKASAHETNTAFNRYCQFQDDTSFKMAKKVKGNSKSKIIQFQGKK